MSYGEHGASKIAKHYQKDPKMTTADLWLDYERKAEYLLYMKVSDGYTWISWEKDLLMKRILYNAPALQKSSTCISDPLRSVDDSQ